MIISYPSCVSLSDPIKMYSQAMLVASWHAFEFVFDYEAAKAIITADSICLAAIELNRQSSLIISVISMNYLIECALSFLMQSPPSYLTI